MVGPGGLARVFVVPLALLNFQVPGRLARHMCLVVLIVEICTTAECIKHDPEGFHQPPPVAPSRASILRDPGVLATEVKIRIRVRAFYLRFLTSEARQFQLPQDRLGANMDEILVYNMIHGSYCSITRVGSNTTLGTSNDEMRSSAGPSWASADGEDSR
jgi:hypothetical protein